MAQARKKRSTKHRGNAAGVVETRGRTGRKLTEDEKRGNAAAKRTTGRTDRFDRPPTWKGAAQRSLVAVVIFVAAMILLLKQPAANSAILGAVLLLAYIPLSYYTDFWLYRRRQAKKLQAAAPTKKDAA